jgi:hypothetical protein
VRSLKINLWLCAFVAFESIGQLSNSTIRQSDEPAEEFDNPYLRSLNNFCDFVPLWRLKSIGQLSNSAIGQSEEPAEECDNP